MQKLKILNKKDVKKILAKVEDQFGGSFDFEDFAFFINTDNKIFIISRKYGELDTTKVRINNRGLYFGKEEADGVRLTIEGSQLIKVKKNVLELTDSQAKAWMKGEDFEVESNFNGYVILKAGKDVLGCAKTKEGKLFNSVQKGRRITGSFSDEEPLKKCCV